MDKTKQERVKNPAAVALGRLGGSAKSDKPKGTAALPKKQRIARARAAARARWAK